jgi:uncharacterized protein
VRFYIDTSAAAKLILAERESDVLMRWLDSEVPSFVTSALTKVELVRFACRYGSESVDDAFGFLGRCDLIDLVDEVLASAATLVPETLRSLDAIHLATALSLSVAIAGVVTYDGRLADACGLHGLDVFAPA